MGVLPAQHDRLTDLIGERLHLGFRQNGGDIPHRQEQQAEETPQPFSQDSLSPGERLMCCSVAYFHPSRPFSWSVAPESDPQNKVKKVEEVIQPVQRERRQLDLQGFEQRVRPKNEGKGEHGVEDCGHKASSHGG